jgi:AcrR family transcriptional regulator
MAERPDGHSRQVRRRKIQDFTRDHILDAAVTVIERGGLEKATMDEIAREAGYGVGTLYNYFESKDDLSVALFRRYFAAVADAFRAPPPEGLDGEAALTWSIAQMLSIAVRARTLMYEFIHRFHRVGLDGAGLSVDAVHERARRIDGLIETVVLRCLRGRRLTCSRRDAAEQLAGFLRGYLGHRLLFGRGSIDPHQDARRIVRTFLHGVIASEVSTCRRR